MLLNHTYVHQLIRSQQIQINYMSKRTSTQIESNRDESFYGLIKDKFGYFMRKPMLVDSAVSIVW